jgi:hypothetical protein
MSLDKSIASGKEHRKPYRKRAQQVDRSCRTGGDCEECRGNRTIANRRREEAAREQEEAT